MTNIGAITSPGGRVPSPTPQSPQEKQSGKKDAVVPVNPLDPATALGAIQTLTQTGATIAANRDTNPVQEKPVRADQVERAIDDLRSTVALPVTEQPGSHTGCTHHVCECATNVTAGSFNIAGNVAAAGAHGAGAIACLAAYLGTPLGLLFAVLDCGSGSFDDGFVKSHSEFLSNRLQGVVRHLCNPTNSCKNNL